MKSAKKSARRSEIDEETPSKETLERRRDRKLKDDITNLMVSSSVSAFSSTEGAMWVVFIICLYIV